MIDSIVSLAKMDESIEAMWLYGSRAKGNASKESDYDLAVLFRQFEQNPLLRRTRPECLALDWVQALGLPEGQVSVLDIEIAPIPLAMAVLTTGRQLLSRNHSKELFVTQRILSKWELDYQYHYKDQDNTYTQSMKGHVDLVVSELEGLHDILAQRPFNRYEYRAAERTIQILIEACIGIAKHWSKAVIGVSPADAYSAFQRLQDHNIPEVMATDWKPIIGMRNALVHDYLNIDQSTVEFIISARKFDDLEKFAISGLNYLARI